MPLSENGSVRLAKLPDEMTRLLAEAGAKRKAQSAKRKALNDEVLEAELDPDDPVSIQAAIQHICVLSLD
jgi:hypothetical protein